MNSPIVGEYAVSVIVCVRNGAGVIRAQLDALDRQVEHPPFELIVCNNGSTDQTESIVKAWIESGDHAAASLKLVQAPERAGIPYARNVGARAAQGRILAFCDADDVVDTQWVGAIARHTPLEGMAGGLVRATDANGIPRPDAFPESLNQSPYLPYAPGCNMAIARQLLLDLHGYDEGLPRYGFDDVDISWRVQLSGRPLVFVPEAIVHMTLSSSRVAFRKRLLLGKGRVLMAHRYPQYDATDYGVGVCLRDIVRATREMLGDALGGDKPALRRTASVSVAGLGRLWGVLAYQVFGTYPPAHFLPAPESWGLQTPASDG